MKVCHPPPPTQIAIGDVKCQNCDKWWGSQGAWRALQVALCSVSVFWMVWSLQVVSVEAEKNTKNTDAVELRYNVSFSKIVKYSEAIAWRPLFTYPLTKLGKANTICILKWRTPKQKQKTMNPYALGCNLGKNWAIYSLSKAPSIRQGSDPTAHTGSNHPP